MNKSYDVYFGNVVCYRHLETTSPQAAKQLACEMWAQDFGPFFPYPMPEARLSQQMSPAQTKTIPINQR